MTERFHLVVATPCFGGQVSSIYASSIFELQRAIRSKSNIDLKVLMRDGDALITRAPRQSDDAVPRRSRGRHIFCSSMRISALRPSRCSG